MNHHFYDFKNGNSISNLIIFYPIGGKMITFDLKVGFFFLNLLSYVQKIIVTSKSLHFYDKFLELKYVIETFIDFVFSNVHM